MGEEAYWFIGRSDIFHIGLFLALQMQQPGRKELLVLPDHTPHACVGLFGLSEVPLSLNNTIAGCRVHHLKKVFRRPPISAIVYGEPYVLRSTEARMEDLWMGSKRRWRSDDEDAQRYCLTHSLGISSSIIERGGT